MLVADTIKLDEVNALAASMLTFASDVSCEADMLELAAQPDQQGKWAGPGPTRCDTAARVCSIQASRGALVLA